MTTYQQYQQQFANSLMAAVRSQASSAVEETATTGAFVIVQNSVSQNGSGTEHSFLPIYTCFSPTITALVGNLVNALPYYEDFGWDSSYRGALINLMQVSLPNAFIAAQPQQQEFPHTWEYGYNGPYSGYRDAFFHGIGATPTTSQMASLVSAADGNLNSGWWGNFALAVLTDAVRQLAGPPINTTPLSADLANYNKSLVPALSPSYLACFQTGYSPTAQALEAIAAQSLNQDACMVLVGAILGGQFNLNVNNAIQMGAPDSDAATWFLYNLWISLKALGHPDVDSVINQAQAAGLDVLSSVAAGTWWTTGICVPFAFSGSDVVNTVAAIAVAALPQQCFEDGQDDGYLNAAMGYAQSLCNWGSLSIYNPPPASCFGQGTGVLMADGSVKSIDQIQLGDQVQSNLGPRKVVLIETPKRGDRTLYQINNLNLFATEGHPFRSAGTAPMRLAINPWAVLDGIPTMIAEGIGELTNGSELMSRTNQATKNISVNQLVSHPPSNQNECVYDLLLENWTKDHPTYFVGGPDTFLAVDTETADPMYNIPGTIAVLTAMQLALPDCRKYLTDPNAQLASLLTSLPLADLRDAAYQNFSAVASENPKFPPIPDPTFYMQNGKWDAHASALEFHLVRHLSPKVRREARMGWRFQSKSPQKDHFTLGVHDVFLLGEASIPPNIPIKLQFNLRGWADACDLVQTLTVDPVTKPTWALFLDQVVDFGQGYAATKPGALIGRLQVGDTPWGQFRAVITEMPQAASVDHFIFGPLGQIIGRISFEQRWVAHPDFLAEAQRSQQWTDRQAAMMAISLGQQIGHKLIKQIETLYTRSKE